MNGFYALVFLIMFIIIIFLSVQVHDCTKESRVVKEDHRDVIMEASNNAYKAATQGHDVFRLQLITQAKTDFDRVVKQYGNTIETEKALKMDEGDMDKIKELIYDQFQYISTDVVERLKKVDKDFYDQPINKYIGMARKRRRRKKKRKHHKPLSDEEHS